MKQGIILSIIASLLFGVISFLSSCMKTLDVFEILSWRITIMFACSILCAGFLDGWDNVIKDLKRLKEPSTLIWSLLATLMIAYQMWIYMWAPNHQHLMDVSLGYFILPLVMVAVGYFFYKEHISRAQQWAILLATLACINSILFSTDFTIYTVSVMIGFPIYFMIKKKIGFHAMSGFLLENALMVPPSIIYLLKYSTITTAYTVEPNIYYYAIALGLTSTFAGFGYLGAHRNLPAYLFGLLSYLEPAAIFFVALILGETMDASKLVTYSLITLSIIVLCIEGGHIFLKQKKKKLI